MQQKKWTIHREKSSQGSWLRTVVGFHKRNHHYLVNSSWTPRSLLQSYKIQLIPVFVSVSASSFPKMAWNQHQKNHVGQNQSLQRVSTMQPNFWRYRIRFEDQQYRAKRDGFVFLLRCFSTTLTRGFSYNHKTHTITSAAISVTFYYILVLAYYIQLQ
jgi:hypothetical protein